MTLALRLKQATVVELLLARALTALETAMVVDLPDLRQHRLREWHLRPQVEANDVEGAQEAPGLVADPAQSRGGDRGTSRHLHLSMATSSRSPSA